MNKEYCDYCLIRSTCKTDYTHCEYFSNVENFEKKLDELTNSGKLSGIVDLVCKEHKKNIAELKDMIDMFLEDKK